MFSIGLREEEEKAEKKRKREESEEGGPLGSEREEDEDDEVDEEAQGQGRQKSFSNPKKAKFDINQINKFRAEEKELDIQKETRKKVIGGRSF